MADYHFSRQRWGGRLVVYTKNVRRSLERPAGYFSQFLPPMAASAGKHQSAAGNRKHVINQYYVMKSSPLERASPNLALSAASEATHDQKCIVNDQN